MTKDEAFVPIKRVRDKFQPLTDCVRTFLNKEIPGSIIQIEYGLGHEIIGGQAVADPKLHGGFNVQLIFNVPEVEVILHELTHVLEVRDHGEMSHGDRFDKIFVSLYGNYELSTKIEDALDKCWEDGLVVSEINLDKYHRIVFPEYTKMFFENVDKGFED